jgi:poly(beta-D-mannuronate) lyase
LKPGDRLTLTGGEWRDARFTFEGHGTMAAPILVRAEGMQFTGAASLTFAGGHLVISGLEFINQVVTQQHHVIFRLGVDAKKPATNCVVHRVRFVNCNAPLEQWTKLRMWLMTVWGADNTVAHCTFADMKTFGQMIAAGEMPPGGRLGLHLLHNRFLDRPKLDDQNGYEIVQIGGSGEMARPSGCLIAGNTFENCSGENEILTLKVSDIFVRQNTFRACQGVVSLRMGDRMLVQGNTFDGAGRVSCGGVGIEGRDHVVIENTLRDLRSAKNFYVWPMLLVAASSEVTGADRSGYGRVKNILIAENRFERCEGGIAAGTYLRPEFPLLPQNVHVRRNVFTGTRQTTPFGFIADDPMLKRELHESENVFEP